MTHVVVFNCGKLYVNKCRMGTNFENSSEDNVNLILGPGNAFGHPGRVRRRTERKVRWKRMMCLQHTPSKLRGLLGSRKRGLPENNTIKRLSSGPTEGELKI